MADYKRMVSYMYQYDNGVKKKNVGYARVEAKNGQCKITLHMQLLGQLDSIFPTYLIQRDENNMDLIYLGDAVLKNHVMDSRLIANEVNIADSGYGFSDMGGLLIFLNDNVFFATEWDDKPIVAKDVLEAMKPRPKNIIAPKEKKTEVETDVVVETETDTEVETAVVVESEIETAKAIKMATAIELGAQVNSVIEEVTEEAIEAVAVSPSRKLQAAKNEVIEENMERASAAEAEIPKYKLPRGWKTVERLHVPKYAGVSNTSDKFMEMANKEKKEKHNIREEKEDDEKTIDNQYKEVVSAEESRAESSYSENQNKAEDNADLYKVEQSNLEEADINRSEDVVSKKSMDFNREEAELPDHPSARKFFENYPKIYPFEDNEITLCVKIEPKDIGLLPKETWGLSNNSFLMHGFYCYHHLIFAKMKDQYGCRYVLGVPGIYHNRERFMAKMFGFESFKSIKKRELKQGDFGYWYVQITF